MSEQDKENKVVGIGHNSGNDVSKEAYEKLANRHKEIIKYSMECLYDVRRLFDEAFTGVRYGTSYGMRKVPTHEKHEKRMSANSQVSTATQELFNASTELNEKCRAMGLKSFEKTKDEDES